jgi:succinate dehydrogenase/fumarate reductase cytochrome b subunit
MLHYRELHYFVSLNSSKGMKKSYYTRVMSFFQNVHGITISLFIFCGLFKDSPSFLDYIYRDIFAFLTGSKTLLFAAASEPPAVRRIRILPMNQHA